MDYLQVRDGKIIDTLGRKVQLRGTCVGGWMNMEHFLNGYPGAEHTQREAMSAVLGPAQAEYFFDRWLDYMLAEEDIAFMKACGATVVRLPLNYRHFESDAEPFKYHEKGFQRLDRALDWCARHELYAILDLHSVQGWQNPDWHCDNDTRHTLFWREKQYQDRFVALWEEIARRYEGRAEVAGYNVMNEPVNGAWLGISQPTERYRTDWERINSIYCRVVECIRYIDARHLIFLEGDLFSQHFQGLEPPFAENLVYSSHNYNSGGFGEVYPGNIAGEFWNYQMQEKVFEAHEGTQYASLHNVPLWVGEFGSGFSDDPQVEAARVRALDDQIKVFEAHDAHWTNWAYKDIGKMSWLRVHPECDYLQIIGPVLEAKRQLQTDFFDLTDSTAAGEAVKCLARLIESASGDPDIDPVANQRAMAQHALNNYAATMLQPAYAKCFKGMSENRIDEVLKAFALQNCLRREEFLSVLTRHMQEPVH